MTLAYNIIMIAVDVAALLFVFRFKSIWCWLAAMAFAGSVAVLAAFYLEESIFCIARLGTWGLFLHGTLLLAASAVIFWLRGQRIPAVGLGVCTLVLLGICIDAFLIEPTRLEVSRVRITSEKLSRPVRIVLIADLQTDQFGDYERDVLRRVVEEDPDVILFAGDYLQAPREPRAKLAEQLNAYMREIGVAAKDGIFAVQGNVDEAGWPDLFDNLDVRTPRRTERFDVAGMRLTCLSTGDSYNCQFRLSNDAPDRFHLVLGHMPNYALGEVEADLLLAGHTHGGQVCIPLLGPVMTGCQIPRDRAAGLSDLPGGGQLLVSRGIGMERFGAPRIRFLCRPQLVVIELSPPE